MKLIRKKISVFLKLEKTHESPLNSKEIKPVIPKGNQPWIFIGRTDGEGGYLMWRKDSWKDSDAGKDEVVGQHRGLNGNEFKQAPGDTEGQESSACCSP